MKLLWTGCADCSRLRTSEHHFTNKWAVHIPGGERVARAVAEHHDFEFHGGLGSLEDYYHLEHHGVSRRSSQSADDHHALLDSHPHVSWAQQQRIKRRVKRGYFSDPLFGQQWYLKNDGESDLFPPNYYKYQRAA